MSVLLQKVYINVQRVRKQNKKEHSTRINNVIEDKYTKIWKIDKKTNKYNNKLICMKSLKKQLKGKIA